MAIAQANSPRCECCDHPLQHAIREALDTFDNAVPPLTVRAVLENLRERLEAWKAAS